MPESKMQCFIRRMLREAFAIGIIFSSLIFADHPKAHACAEAGHLDGYRKGSTLGQIIKGMNSACPSTITLNAGMNGFAVCEDSRFSRHGKTIFLIGSGNRVIAIRRGPNSYGSYCAW